MLDNRKEHKILCQYEYYSEPRAIVISVEFEKQIPEVFAQEVARRWGHTRNAFLLSWTPETWPDKPKGWQ